MLNSDYHAVTADGIDLFKHKQSFIQAAFDKVLKTNRGKTYVREYEGDYNAQSVHQKLITFYNKSTNSRVSASITLS